MMKKIAFAAAFAAMMSPAYAETKPEDGKKTEATKVETTKAETEKAEEKKKELTPEEKAAKAEKEAKLAEEKAKLMGAGEPRDPRGALGQAPAVGRHPRLPRAGTPQELPPRPWP